MYRPLSSLDVVRFVPLSVLVTLTCAPGTKAAEASRMAPDNVADGGCANAVSASKISNADRSRTFRTSIESLLNVARFLVGALNGRLLIPRIHEQIAEKSLKR